MCKSTKIAVQKAVKLPALLLVECYVGTFFHDKYIGVNGVILIFFVLGVRRVFVGVRWVCARLGADGYLRLSK